MLPWFCSIVLVAAAAVSQRARCRRWKLRRSSEVGPRRSSAGGLGERGFGVQKVGKTHGGAPSLYLCLERRFGMCRDAALGAGGQR